MKSPHDRQNKKSADTRNRAGITFEEWRAALDEESLARATVDVPEGWFSMRGFAELMQTTNGYAWKLMNRLLISGKAESKNFTVRIGNCNRLVPHYRLKNGQK